MILKPSQVDQESIAQPNVMLVVTVKDLEDPKLDTIRAITAAPLTS